jgi:hypothetical protein
MGEASATEPPARPQSVVRYDRAFQSLKANAAFVVVLVLVNEILERATNWMIHGSLETRGTVAVIDLFHLPRMLVAFVLGIALLLRTLATLEPDRFAGRPALKDAILTTPRGLLALGRVFLVLALPLVAIFLGFYGFLASGPNVGWWGYLLLMLVFALAAAVAVFAVRYFLAVTVAVVERSGVSEAAGRSRTLLYGHKKEVVGFFSVWMSVFTCLTFAIRWVVPTEVNLVVTGLVGGVFDAFASIMNGVVYLEATKSQPAALSPGVAGSSPPSTT